MLDLAARAALRAQGRVEPNPLVGCVIADAEGRVLAVGHHRRFGGPHAEAEALASARARGVNIRGATVYVTLEPCNHHGKTPPCARALIDAGVGEVVIAREDPHHLAKGGSAALRAAGIRVRLSTASDLATRLADPFITRATLDRPWVIAKWAQSVDGRVATRAGDSKWISGERSRALVHRWRSRVDCVLTGAGTALADDPLLTARTPRPARRIPIRAVVDPSLRTSGESNLVRTARNVPLVLFCGRDVATSPRADALRSAGATVVPLPGMDDGLDLAHGLRWLASERDATNVLVEAGPRLVGSLLRQGLVDELRVFVAPILLADAEALPPAFASPLDRIADAARLKPTLVKRIGEDTLLAFRAR